ncbi:BTAD domain-containing putative transcriptional regulator [Longimicrobium sp.]|uniref:BTAD domain-containing putative transcriptional regulator n=1 Tax=Longimicrobium sp. TaxID=2029185 RepID=UPI003B3A3122
MILIHVLGAPVIRRAEGPITGRAAHRRRLALIAILAAARGRPVGRERIIGLLWPENPSDAARHTLSEGLYVLRKDLGDDAFVVMGDEVALDPAIARSDLDDFEQALADGRWEDAVNAYGGPFLDGFYVADAAEFERWAEGERDRLARGYGRALEELAAAAEAVAPIRAAEWWRRLLAHDPFSSRVALRLVRALACGGERAAALRAAEAHVVLLREELGVGPEPELASLIEDLRSEPPAPPPRPPRPAAAPAPPPPSAGPVDEDDAPAPDPVAPSAGPAAVLAGSAVSADRDARAAAADPPGAARTATPASAESDDRPARRRKRRFGFAAAGLVAVALVLAALAARRDPAPRAEPRFDPRRIAVLYLDDYSPGGELQYLANGLTEMLIHELSQVQALDVVSRNGVKPYREGSVPFDSMVADLRVGSVVEGSVQRSGDSVRVVVQLIDGNTHSHLVSRVVIRPLGDVLALERAVSEEVSGFLREQLGASIRQREAVGGTRSPAALELALRGEQAYADAVALHRSSNPDDVASALRALDGADALLARAEAADPRWWRPTLARAWVALQTASWSEGMRRAMEFDSAAARAERVLARDPANARALEVRGTALWFRSVDPGSETATLQRASERDLRAAVAADPELASAWGTLSFLYYVQARFAESAQTAEKALEHDAWLEHADDVLERLFFSQLSIGDYRAAAETCERGRRARPRDWRFVECRLTLLREDRSRPADPAAAWRLVAELDALDPPPRAAATGRTYAPIYRRLVAAAVSARAGQADSARAVLARARLDAAADPESRVSMPYDEAYILLLLGERAQARERLEVYLAQRPEMRAFTARDPLMRELLTSSPSR